MYKVLAFLVILVSIYTASAYAQEPRLATYQEVASIIVDQKISNNVTAAVSLQTTSIQEFQIPPELEEKILNQTGLVAIVVTNEDRCVLGVDDSICIMINSKRMEGEGGIRATQDRARQIGDSLIDDLNSALSFDAKFHSVFIHYDDKTNKALGTSGNISGAGTVSAVYTAQMESADFMFNKVSGALIPRQIKQYGGFYDIAENLARDDSSRMVFTILPTPQGLIMQIKVSKDYPNMADGIVRINPHEFLKTEQIKKSRYFDAGFFPLNSLIHLAIIPDDESAKIQVKNTIPAEVKNGEMVPSDLTQSGWFITSESSESIEALYLFGTSDVASAEEIVVILTDKDTPEVTIPQIEVDESYVLVGIGVAAAGAAAFYLRGMRKKPRL